MYLQSQKQKFSTRKFFTPLWNKTWFVFSLFPLLERCPTFRDQPPGSTATYNGKCYIFYNQQPNNFQGAMDFCSSRGGTLVDESNPALQGFLSWELWRRHKVHTYLCNSYTMRPNFLFESHYRAHVLTHDMFSRIYKKNYQYFSV